MPFRVSCVLARHNHVTASVTVTIFLQVCLWLCSVTFLKFRVSACFFALLKVNCTVLPPLVRQISPGDWSGQDSRALCSGVLGLLVKPERAPQSLLGLRF